MRFRPTLTALGVAALLLPLAACDDGDPQPSSTPPATPSASTTPIPTKPAPPSIPPAALDGLTVTSAEAFARYYIAALDHAEATGDAGIVRKWSGSTCAACRETAELFEGTYRSGGSLTGQTRTIIGKIVEVKLVGADKGKVVLQARHGATNWKPKAGASPTPLAGSNNLRIDLYLIAVAGHWTVYTLTLKE